MPPIIIRTGSITQAQVLEEAIPEFTTSTEPSVWTQRLEGHRHRILLATVAGRPVGFKVAYEREPGTCYSWLGGVLPPCRGLGVATKLRLTQERWAKTQGFDTITLRPCE